MRKLTDLEKGLIVFTILFVGVMYYLALVELITEYEQNKDSYHITLECENGDIEHYDNISHMKKFVLVCGNHNPYFEINTSLTNFNLTPNIYK